MVFVLHHAARHAELFSGVFFGGELDITHTHAISAFELFYREEFCLDLFLLHEDIDRPEVSHRWSMRVGVMHDFTRWSGTSWLEGNSG